MKHKYPDLQYIFQENDLPSMDFHTSDPAQEYQTLAFSVSIKATVCPYWYSAVTMVLILDGNSVYVAHALRKKNLEEKFLTALELI